MNSPISIPASNLAATMSSGPLSVVTVEDDVRVLPGELRQPREEHHRRGDPRHDHPQPSGRPLAQAADAVECDPDVAQRGTDLREELVSRLGGRDASRRAGQQANAEALLQAADRMAQGRGRDAEPNRGLREAALLGNGDEVRQHAGMVRDHC